MTENNNQNDDNLGAFYMGRMRNPPEPRRILPKGLLTVITVLAFVGIIWYAYPQGQEKFSSMNVPTITADTTPYRFKPENPGGMEVPHQDSTVFDPIDNKSADSSKIEKLGAPPEDPVDADFVLASKPPVRKPDTAPDTGLQIKEMSNGTEKVVPKTADKTESKPVKKIEAKASPLPKTEPVPTLKADTLEPAAGEDDEPALPPGVESVKEEPLNEPIKAAEPPPVTPEPVKEEPKPEPAKVEKPKAAEAKPAPAATPAAPAKKDGIYIQLGSYRDIKAAKADWSKLQKKFPQSLGKMSMHLETADLGTKGVYHRLQSKVASEDRAKQICKVMKSSGNPDCIVVH